MVGPAGPARQFPSGMMGSSQRRSPSWLVAESSLSEWVVRGGLRRTRRKPVHGGSMAPSMAPTVLRSPPRPAPDSFLRTPTTEENQKIKKKAEAGRCALRRRIAGICVVAGQRPALPTDIHALRGFTVSTKVAPHEQQTMPFQQIVGICRRRGGSGCGGVRGMDAAAKPPRVRALCLRSTASQAPERTAASGWAGLGVYGVPRNRTHPAIPPIPRF